jgi:hypothetical protein
VSFLDGNMHSLNTIGLTPDQLREHNANDLQRPDYNLGPNSNRVSSNVPCPLSEQQIYLTLGLLNTSRSILTDGKAGRGLFTPTIGSPDFDPSSVPMPTLAPIDVFDFCTAWDDHLADRRQRREDIDKLAEALHHTDMSVTAIEGILEAAKDLPLGAQLVGVTAPSGWIWTHPSAGLAGPIMPSQGNAMLNSAIRSSAGSALRFVSVGAIGLDALQVGYQLSEGYPDRAAYAAADGAISYYAVTYFKLYGAGFALAYKGIGGTEAVVKASAVSGLAYNCAAQNGYSIP